MSPSIRFFRSLRCAPVLPAAALVALLVAGCSAGGNAPLPTIPPVTPGSSLPPGTVGVTMIDIQFVPREITLPAKGTIALRNEGGLAHNLTIQDAATHEALLGSKDLPMGGTQSLSVGLPAGTYRIVCTLNNHETLGMIGTLTIIP